MFHRIATACLMFTHHTGHTSWITTGKFPPINTEFHGIQHQDGYNVVPMIVKYKYTQTDNTKESTSSSVPKRRNESSTKLTEHVRSDNGME
mmetsp:Transcript_51463/g.55707  ORF Transcript_51463/g.55707 Transcript_51463/m.55707 type:complete len:91 (-) Transcript_51463:129-401(-)